MIKRVIGGVREESAALSHQQRPAGSWKELLLALQYRRQVLSEQKWRTVTNCHCCERNNMVKEELGAGGSLGTQDMGRRSGDNEMTDS